MNHWCESCARKNLCYVSADRPKCFVPITNTASGPPYLVGISSISRDSHEIAKDEPQIGYMTEEQTESYRKMVDSASSKSYGNIFEDNTKDITKNNDSCNDNKLTLEEALMLSLDMALAECKKRHGGCENCYVECAWREPQNIEGVNE